MSENYRNKAQYQRDVNERALKCALDLRKWEILTELEGETPRAKKLVALYRGLPTLETLYKELES